MEKRAHPAGTASAPELSERQRRHLGALAHALKPMIRLGSAGLTAAIARETERALHDHELIKVKASGGARAARDQVFASARAPHRQHSRTTHRQRRGTLPPAARTARHTTHPGRLSRRTRRGGPGARYSKRDRKSVV